MIIGVISDTHGLLRPEALQALEGSNHIVHAGDIGEIRILEVLAKIAPVTAIRGNIDVAGQCADLPATEAVELGGKLFYLVHSLRDLDLNVQAAGIACVVSGHTHKASSAERDGILYLNPGSAGPRRFSLPVTLAKLTLLNGRLTAITIDLKPGA